MTTWIGTLGAMRPTPCLTGLSVATDDTSLTGGGAGTLAPRRRLVLTGPGARRLRAAVDVSRLHDMASLVSLARYQHRTGTALRVIPCGTSAANMLTPGASEEFAGWTGTALTLGPGMRAVEPETVHERFINPGTPLDASLILDESLELRGRHWDTRSVVVDRNAWPGVVATLNAGATTMSPVVPLLDAAPWRVHAGVFVASQGTVTLTAEALSSGGGILASVSMQIDSLGLRRHVLSWDLTDPAVSVRVKVAASTMPATIAWPSVSLGVNPHRHVLGGGIDAAWVTPPVQDVLHAVPGNELSGYAYDIEELA